MTRILPRFQNTRSPATLEIRVENRVKIALSKSVIIYMIINFDNYPSFDNFIKHQPGAFVWNELYLLTSTVHREIEKLTKFWQNFFKDSFLEDAPSLSNIG